MKGHIQYACLLVLILAFSACVPEKVDSDRPQFSEYLDSLHTHAQVPPPCSPTAEDMHYYLVLTQYGCTGCSRQVRDDYPHLAAVSNLSTILVYNEKRSHLPQKFTQIKEINPDVILDTAGLIHNYPFGILSDGVIITKGGCYYDSIMFQKDNFDMVYSMLGVSL